MPTRSSSKAVPLCGEAPPNPDTVYGTHYMPGTCMLHVVHDLTLTQLHKKGAVIILYLHLKVKKLGQRVKKVLRSHTGTKWQR